MTEPAPASGDTAYVTAFTYDDADRLDTTTLPDGGVVNRDYWLTGDLKKVSGARTYTQEYTYDTAGCQTTLTTSGGGVTTWNYEADSAASTRILRLACCTTDIAIWIPAKAVGSAAIRLEKLVE